MNEYQWVIVAIVAIGGVILLVRSRSKAKGSGGRSRGKNTKQK
jgi:hypothetical protein